MSSIFPSWNKLSIPGICLPYLNIYVWAGQIKPSGFLSWKKHCLGINTYAVLSLGCALLVCACVSGFQTQCSCLLSVLLFSVTWHTWQKQPIEVYFGLWFGGTVMMAGKVQYLVRFNHAWSVFTIIACWQTRKQCLLDLQLDPKSSSLPTCTPHHPTRYHTPPEIMMLLVLGPSVHIHEPVEIFHIQTLTQPPSKHSTTELPPPLTTFDVQTLTWCHCWLAFTQW